ncbi:MAG TPA: hypothetical protein VF669_20715, partial [Tepidisphaeraceae bacterium]
MENLKSKILSTWTRLTSTTTGHPLDLDKRLSRRRSAMMQRPPRACCLAIRAADHRITDATAILTPSPLARHDPTTHKPVFNHIPHTVTIDSELIHKLCLPVCIDPPGEPAYRIAARLGVHPNTLTTGRLSGFFHTRYVPLLNGRRGK